jgi:hypothetical protein
VKDFNIASKNTDRMRLREQQTGRAISLMKPLSARLIGAGDA